MEPEASLLFNRLPSSFTSWGLELDHSLRFGWNIMGV